MSPWKRWLNLGFLCPDKVEKFCNDFWERAQILKEIEDFAAREKVPILLPISASLLSLIVRLKEPSRVLEIGTGIGYSTAVIKLSGARFIKSVDSSKVRLQKAEEFFQKHGLREKVEFVQADAFELIRRELCEGRSYDFIFVDSVKSEYPFLVGKLHSLLSESGVLIFDNVLFRGFVSSEDVPRKYERTVKLLRLFLKSAKQVKGFENFLVPVGDGFLISLRKPPSFG